MKTRIFSAVLLWMTSAALAQPAAPRETVSATLQGKKVSIEYGRPSLKGRSFDALMSQLPPDRMWRAGSEQVTTLSTEGDIRIGKETVPAGKYSLYVYLPEEGNPRLAVNRTLGQPLGKIWDQAPANLKNEPWPYFDYSKEIKDQELLRVPLAKSAGSNLDMFTITLKKSGMGAELSLAWGEQRWTVPVASAH